MRKTYKTERPVESIRETGLPAWLLTPGMAIVTGLLVALIWNVVMTAKASLTTAMSDPRAAPKCILGTNEKPINLETAVEC